MTFTDDDWKRMREDVRSFHRYDLSEEEFDALIARLEAAEHLCSVPYPTKAYFKAEDAWRKAAGK